jgi:hypothetical protein
MHRNLHDNKINLRQRNAVVVQSLVRNQSTKRLQLRIVGTDGIMFLSKIVKMLKVEMRVER